MSGPEENISWKRVETAILDFFVKKRKKFTDLWHRIGIPCDQQDKRIGIIEKHITELLEDMTNEEEGYEKRLLSSIKSLQQQANCLCDELSAPRMIIDPAWKHLYVEAALKHTVNRLQKQKTERIKKFKTLKQEELFLCEKMNVPITNNIESVPTESDISLLEQIVTSLAEDCKSRTEQVSSISQQILKIYEKMSIVPQNESFEKYVFNWNTQCLSNDNIDRLNAILEDAKFEYQEFLNKIDILWESINRLWTLVDCPADVIEQFKSENVEYSPKVLQALLAEEDRLKAIRLNSLRDTISEIRQQIFDIWDFCQFGQQQRSSFSQVFDDVFTEESLHQHEVELSRLLEYKKSCQDIIEIFNRRNELWNNFWQFETHRESASRLMNRGCVLLKEERLRKTVSRELPKIESELSSSIDAWELEKDTFFIVNDRRLLEIIKSQYDALAEEKENMKRQRQTLKEHSSRTATPIKRTLNVSLASSSFTSCKKRQLESTFTSFETSINKRLEFGTPKLNRIIDSSFIQQTPKNDEFSTSYFTPNRITPGNERKITAHSAMTYNRSLLREVKRRSLKPIFMNQKSNDSNAIYDNGQSFSSTPTRLMYNQNDVCDQEN